MSANTPDNANGATAELLATAYHEAGHAVMAIQLGRTLQKVTVVPGQLQTGGVRLGVCKMQKGRSKASQDWIEDDVLILYAGMVAESQFTGKYSAGGAQQDLRMARQLLQQRARTERQLEKLQRRMFDKTVHFLSDDATKAAIKLVADELVARATVTGRAVRHFIEQAERQHS